MFRIDDSSFVLKPIATEVKPSWLNATQESICRVIEASGLKIPKEKDHNEGHYNLLAEAINKLTRFQERSTSVTIPLTKARILEANYNNYKMALLQFTISIEDANKQIVCWESFQLMISKCNSKLLAQKSQRLSEGERYDLNFEFNSVGQLLLSIVPPTKYNGVNGTIIIRTLEERQ